MARLAYDGVHKRYGDIQALRGLDMEVRDGELMTLVGPSGCGKTTALRVAAGLEEVTGGTIRIGDRDVTDVDPHERNVSMVFQSYALFPHMSVRENIGFGLSVRKVAKQEIAGRVEEASRMVGCAPLLERKPFQLSGGERQRVALARALVREPDVFLLDEPLSNLDAQLRVQMRAELKRLHQRVARTMIYVTHDQVEALTLGERVAVLDQGVLQQLGTPDDVYNRPANRFVAGFIGSPAMNFLRGSIQDGHVAAGPFRVAVPHGTEAPEEVEVGIRPEHLRLRTDGEGTAAQVEVLEVAGDETFVHLNADGHPLVVRTGGGLRPQPGETVRLEIPRDKTYLFDPATGRTLSPAS